MSDKLTYAAIVMGVSAGGLNALETILGRLPSNFSLPVIVAQHRTKDDNNLLESLLQEYCNITIKPADEKEKILPGTAYFAPAGYHLLVENDRTFSLSVDRYEYLGLPSIDILFETAAEVYGEQLIGAILTGSNSDGSRGIIKIAACGGVTIAQNPKKADYPYMPDEAIRTGHIRHIMELEEISNFLLKCSNQ